MRTPFRISRRALGTGLLTLAAPPVRAGALYRLDQRSAVLEFTARQFGLATIGRFTDFSAELLDPASPATARALVTVRTAGIEHPQPGAASLLRSAEFFDVLRHPQAHFAGAGSGTDAAGRIKLDGLLTVRGIARPFAMAARIRPSWRGRTRCGRVLGPGNAAAV